MFSIFVFGFVGVWFFYFWRISGFGDFWVFALLGFWILEFWDLRISVVWGFACLDVIQLIVRVLFKFLLVESLV